MVHKRSLIKCALALMSVVCCIVCMGVPVLASDSSEDVSFTHNVLHLDTIEYSIYDMYTDEDYWLSFANPFEYVEKDTFADEAFYSTVRYGGKSYSLSGFPGSAEEYTSYTGDHGMLYGLNFTLPVNNISMQQVTLRSSDDFILNYQMYQDAYYRTKFLIMPWCEMQLEVSCDLLYPVFHEPSGKYEWRSRYVSVETSSFINTGSSIAEFDLLPSASILFDGVDSEIYDALYDGYIVCRNFQIDISYYIHVANSGKADNNDLATLRLVMPYLIPSEMPSVKEVMDKYPNVEKEIVYVEVDTDMPDFGGTLLSICQSFLDFQFAPNFSFGDLLGIIVGFTVLFLILKFFGK